MGDLIFTTGWDDRARILSTRFSGRPALDDVQRWRDDLYALTRSLPENTPFKLLADLRGYAVEDVERVVHFEQRTVIPAFLAAHNFRAGYLDLYDVDVPLTPGAGNVNCIAVAHVHHECHKMEAYDQQFGRPNEHYFCDRAAAEDWINALDNPN